MKFISILSKQIDSVEFIKSNLKSFNLKGGNDDDDFHGHDKRFGNILSAYAALLKSSLARTVAISDLNLKIKFEFLGKNKVFKFVEIPIDCKKEDEENSNEDSNSDIIPDIPSKDDIAKDLETQFFNILVSQGSTPSELLGQLITLFQSCVSDPTYDYPTFLTQLGTFL